MTASLRTLSANSSLVADSRLPVRPGPFFASRSPQRARLCSATTSPRCRAAIPVRAVRDRPRDSTAAQRHGAAIQSSADRSLTPPKDGTKVIAYGLAYAELANSPYNSWITADTEKPRKPFVCLVQWYEAWYDHEVEIGDGTYRKERKLSSAGWQPHHYAFTPTHWMPLPSPPTAEVGSAPPPTTEEHEERP